jgi:alpha-L-fucosidase 2
MLQGNFAANLYDFHPPFQIDGNFGYASGVGEMLVQSHMGEIHLLPALPDAWPEGSVQGIKARGGFDLDIYWKNGKMTEARLYSNKGGTCKVRSATPVTLTCQGQTVPVTSPEKGAIAFETRKGREYRLTATD